MKAVVMTATGSPEVLQVQQLPQPQIQHPSDLLVRLKAASVNPIDIKIRQRGPYYPDSLPAILGLDGAGVVEAVGPEVRHFSVGDEVYFCNGGLGDRPGTYAEYTLVDERCVALKPRSLSFTEAAAVPLVLITAWEALYERVRLAMGQQILIHGGAGGVGHMAIQLAKMRGSEVCTTISSEEKAHFVGLLGADHCIYYPRINFVEAVLHLTGNRGIDAAFDTIGEPILSKTFSAVRLYGDVVTLHATTAETDWKTARSRNLRISYELMLTPLLQNLIEARQQQARILKQGARCFEVGKLKIHVGQTYPLEQAAEAHRQLEAGSIMGKVVLVMA
ncbi:MAG: zinc-dependent alcohol dehydrogenase family protein [Cyanobacteria bacterium Co-bin8]|nr:zinc-dependent alcohol dehydrogenase family protein [Cyanobacteria bacterium Co-bin8]